MNPRQCLILILIYNVWQGKGARQCTLQDHCYDTNMNRTYMDGDTWHSVNNDTNSCMECVCIESKEYTVSCVDLTVSDRNWAENVRKSTLDTLPPTSASSTKSAKSPLLDEEVVLPEDLALQMRCINRKFPEFDPEKQTIKLKLVHYLFVKRTMYCCGKSVEFKTVHSSCKVVFNNFCISRVVLQDNEDVLCDKPYEMRVI